MNEAANQNEDTATEQQSASVDLNVNDLSLLKNLIDVVTTRGAFKANEMSTVGVLYDKLSNFLNSVSNQNAEKQGE
jgi:hypothetical protein